MTATRQSRDALENFRQYNLELLEQLHSAFPECPDAVAVIKQYSAMMDVDGVIMSAVRAHYNHLITPLESEVAYSAPLGRLKVSAGCTPDFATMYDAYVYTDADVVLQSGYGMIDTLKLREKWSDPAFDQESKRSVFDYLCAINECTYLALDMSPPRTFTVDEIQEEIEARQPQPAPGANMTLGFRACLLALVDCIEQASPSDQHAACQSARDRVIAMQPKDAIQVWSEVVNPRIHEACATKDWSVIVDAMQTLGETVQICNLPLGGVCGDLEDIWTRLDQLNVLARLHVKTPPHLLEVIEQRAGAIAEHMANGTFDLSSGAIMAMGEEIMTQCNGEDLQLFTQLINDELSTILSAFVNPATSAAGLDPGMLSTMSMLVQNTASAKTQ